MASATLAPSASLHRTSALEARIRRGRRRDAEGAQGAETASEAPDLPPRFAHGEGNIRVQALGRFRIGGGTYFVWALPPNAGGTAQRHVQVHSHTTSSSTT